MHTYLISYDTKYTKNILWTLCQGENEVEACMNLFNVMEEAVTVTGCERLV